ncbi:amino acid ABC transporter substrate-binding protein [Actinomycetota bacterium]|nr:amino acid ABC transporter substrate-binding protein [Actinomycetota bacterium]MDB0039372.1 amino acid ABC transporter substrate-binding protein [Actinomycetota bacterium]MDC1474246.1 amino acid ABC transporter substrate-binding protein [Candidatus Nanopelagicales bacterium]
MKQKKIGGGRRASALFASLAVAGLLATACSSSDTADSTGSETASESASDAGGGEPIRIGISLPLTGDFSQPGGEAQKGYNAWAADVNEAGGLLGRQVELVVLDDASSQEQVVTDYNRLINEEKVDLLLGTFSSLLNYPASAVAENNEMVLIAPAGGSPKIFEQNFKYYFFAQQAVAPDQANPFVNMIAGLPDDQKPKTAAYAIQDDPFAAPVIESMQAQLEAMGVETVYSEMYPPETTNFQPFASAIAKDTPDLVAQGAVFEDGVNLVKSLAQVGFSPKIMFQTSAPSNGAQFTDAIGTGNEEGIFYAVSWSEKANTPGNAEFLATYEAQNGAGVPAEDAADAYAAAEVLAAAVEGVGSLDNVALQEWLHANSVTTILGDLSWDEIGRPQGEFLLAQWQGGSVDIVEPASAATTENLVMPKPGWK